MPGNCDLSLEIIKPARSFDLLIFSFVPALTDSCVIRVSVLESANTF